MRLLFTCLFLTKLGAAATVTSINTAKKIIKIDEGVAGGFDKGAKVCFLNEANKKVGCARVGKSTPTHALIRIKSDKLLGKIQKGMAVELASGTAEVGTGEVTVAESTYDARHNFKLAYILTAMTPTKFNKLTYAAPTTASASGLGSLWKKDSVTSMSLFAVVAEGEFGIGESLSMAIGLRYRMFGAYEAVSDYNTDPTLIEKFVSIEQKSSAIGFYTDFGLLNVAFTPSFHWKLTSGLDIDMPSVDFKATQKNESGTESVSIATYKSSMTLASLRLGTAFTFVISPVGLIIPGLNVVVPLAVFGAKESAEVADPQESMLSSKNGEDDLKKSIAHTKNSVALEILLGTSIIF